MENNSEQKQISAEEVLDAFNEILGNQIERLLGTRQGIEELPMNVLTISSLVLLAARETEIESFPYIPPDRYTNKKLAHELTEISIEPGEELELQILEMVEKNYIEVSNDGRFFVKKPTKSMSQLIDRIFPNMLGLNMVAYIG